ncbi:histidine kinase [Mesorhizobium abyssinicae]|uniref:sensor histidine kinase n=1 Tax=Mesorhizobium abyssinicae TaxID=1209958 RepID=UPI002A24454C|nr:histidine kinase [Mesorhizobium abyssinicae]MDX8437567.1 histidine kinase [Mesorhizobium abyssinicae]
MEVDLGASRNFFWRGTAGHSTRLGKWFRGVRPWQMVAASRFALAVFALLAIYADPSQPARSSALAYYLLGGYVVYAGALALATIRVSPRPVVALAVHAVDIAVFSILIYLTEGPTSPLFVFLTFALFSATLRWSWRGVVATAILIVLVYGLLAVTADIDTGEDITRTIVRSAYLIVAGILFLYFGAILERERLRYAQLASWPDGPTTDERFPALDPIFAHLSKTANVPGLLVVWEDHYEPYRYVAEFADGSTRYSMEAAADFKTVIQDNTRSGAASGVQNEISMRILSDRGIRHSVVAPIGGASHSGWLSLVGEHDLGDDLMPLAAIAALRIGAEIEHHYLRQQLVKAAMREGRSRLARDMHDSLLQSLAAIALQLKALERDVAAPERRQIAEIRGSVAEQQGLLRQLVSEARGKDRGRAADTPVEAAVADVLRKMEAQWNCRMSLAVSPGGLVASQETVDGLSLFMAEAVANGVRHGGATKFRLDVAKSEKALSIRLQDNGSGLPGLSGSLSHKRVFEAGLGSASLRRRAIDLGAIMHLHSSPEGLEIDLKVPIG